MHMQERVSFEANSIDVDDTALDLSYRRYHIVVVWHSPSLARHTPSFLC
jgi:hypothetical protein